MKSLGAFGFKIKTGFIGASLWALAVSSPASAEHNRYGNFVPNEGFIPNEGTAVSVADAVLRALWGEEIDNELPLKATLEKGVWIVRGTWKKLPGHKGGVSEIWISKKSGEIIKVTGGM